MGEQLEELYQELLRDHHKNPRHRGEIQNPTGTCLVHNPLCGDEVKVDLKARVETNGEGRIEEVSFTGKGCSISQASASMMTELVLDKTIAEAKSLTELFRRMLREELSPSELERLGDAASLSGVKKFAARIKCAQLAWEALDQAIKKVPS